MQIHALIFDLECPPPASRQRIAWIDEHGNSKHTQHAHPDMMLLDVEAGHVVVNRRSQYIVTGVRPYRTSLCRDEAQYPVAESVREVLAVGLVNDAQDVARGLAGTA